MNFVDVNLNTLNIDIEKIEKTIDKNTVAILAINLLGNPCNFEKINKICKKYNLILLEDNCESMHAKFKKKYCGTFGLMGTFSLYFSHHIQTMEGGVILTDNVEIYNILRSLRAHGWSRELNKKNKLYKKSKDDFYNLFTFITPGYNFRPLEIQAAVGLEQLKKQKKFNLIRKKNAKYFYKKFSNLRNYIIQKIEPYAESSYFSFNIILKGCLRNKRDMILKKIKKNGIEVRPTVAGNILKNPVVKFLDYKKNDQFNNSNYIHNNGFFVGNYPKNLKKEIDLLFNILSSYK